MAWQMRETYVACGKEHSLCCLCIREAEQFNILELYLSKYKIIGRVRGAVEIDFRKFV
jgi:hypothetical protein